jgi:hypothetical protein
MQNLTRKTVQEIISLADTAYPQTNEPPRIISLGDLTEEALSGLSNEKKALLFRIEALNESELLELTTLYWLGRDGGASRDWDGLLAHAKQTHNDDSADYLAWKTNLAECLREGMSKLKH